ncbi:MAG: sigma-70 family RNA polymerase sigma factor [bacterium]
MKSEKHPAAENAPKLARTIAAHVVGDEAAANEIISFLRDPVRAEARQFLRSDNIDYDDVVQETIIAVLNYLRKNGGFTGDLIKFAVTVVRNRCRNILNTQRRRRQVPVESLANRLTSALFSNPLQTLLDREIHQLLQSALDDLGPDCRTLLRAVYCQGKRCKDLIAPLGLKSVHGVYRRRSVCLAKLNRIVKKRLGICSSRRGR